MERRRESGFFSSQQPLNHSSFLRMGSGSLSDGWAGEKEGGRLRRLWPEGKPYNAMYLSGMPACRLFFSDEENK